MSEITDLQAAIDAATDRLTSEVAEHKALLTSIQQQLADCLASGASVAVLQGIKDKVDAAVAALDADTPAPPTP